MPRVEVKFAGSNQFNDKLTFKISPSRADKSELRFRYFQKRPRSLGMLLQMHSPSDLCKIFVIRIEEMQKAIITPMGLVHARDTAINFLQVKSTKIIMETSKGLESIA